MGFSHFRFGNDENYNCPFVCAEFDFGLLKCEDCTPSLDSSHYQMLKHLPKILKLKILKIFNRLWENDLCPASLKKAYAISISKAGKYRKSHTGYSLTSYAGNFLKRMTDQFCLFPEIKQFTKQCTVLFSPSSLKP